MSTAHVAGDSLTLLGRNLRHVQRYLSVPIFVAGVPIIFLLIFVYVLGGTLGAGLGGDRTDYLTYLVPGILVLALATSAAGTATAVATDMTEGIIARFRTMAISRAAVITGHVIASMLQALGAVLAVLLVALLVGYRPSGGLPALLGAASMITLIALAITWLAVGMGMAAKTIESASNSPTLLQLLPFLGSGFVPTDSLPGPLRWFADVQPFTAFIETTRALLAGAPLHPGTLLATLVWCAVLGIGGYAWSLHLYERRSLR